MSSTTGNSPIGTKGRSPRLIVQFENHPAMPALLKELSPRITASLFQQIGIGDTTALMAMMPTRALLLTFDEFIWRSAKPGMAETINVSDLIEWFAAWSEIGETFLIEKLEAMSEDYLTTVLSRIVTVESISRHAVYGDIFDGDVDIPLVDLMKDNRERFGPYIVEPSVEGEDTIREVVRALWNSDPQKFFRIFGRMSDLPNPDDSTRGSTPTLHDIEFEREAFREASGFVTAGGARGFFALADRLTATEIIALKEYDVETRRYLDAIARSPDEIFHPIANPVISEALEDDEEKSSVDSMHSIAETHHTAPLRVLLEQSQLLPNQSTAPLLQDARRSKDLALTTKLRLLADENIDRYHARARELAYLANVLRWLPTDADRLHDNDAKGAAFAVCNLGFELAGTRANEIDSEPGLIRLFLLGWNALSSIRGSVVGAFAKVLSRNLKLAPWVLGEATVGLVDLRKAIEGKQFSEAREAVIFLSIVFDSKDCRAIAPLLDAIPRFSSILENKDNSEPQRWITTKTDLEILNRLLDSLRAKR